MRGLYIHIPFCLKKCAYCDFVSFPGLDMAESYIAALIKEIELCGAEYKGTEFDTVFFGGGTPSALPPSFVEKVMVAIKQHFSLQLKEATIECNPGTVTEEKLAAYREAGFNRLSFGVQSFDEDILKGIGRIHTSKQAEECVEMARRAGFDNINLDLMYGLPNQTTEKYLESIEVAAELGVQHISAYSLILEEGTPLYLAVEEGITTLPDEDETYKMHRAGMERLEQLGYSRYEISNYAKPGYECQHNLVYWANGEYLGLGLNSHSAMRRDGKWLRFCNTSELKAYLAALSRDQLPVLETQDIPPKEEMFECIMLGLRTIKGVSLVEFEKRFGKDALNIYAVPVSKLEKLGYLAVDKGRMYLTDRGLDMQNTALMEFMD